MVRLGVGVTVVVAFLETVPPKVASRLATKRSKSSGATYTCVVSYCDPTAKFGVATAAWAAAGAVRGNSDRRALPKVRTATTAVTARALLIRIEFSLSKCESTSQLRDRLAVSTKLLHLHIVVRSDQDVETSHAVRVDKYDPRCTGIVEEEIARCPTWTIEQHMGTLVVHLEHCRGTFRVGVGQLHRRTPGGVEQNLHANCAIRFKQLNDRVSRPCRHYDSGMALAIDNLNLIRDHR